MILDAKEVSQSILDTVKEETKNLKNKDIFPTLGIIRVGEDPGSVSYEKSIYKLLEPLGIQVRSFVLDKDTTEDIYLEKLEELNRDDSVHGILLFKPFPKEYNEEKIIYTIDPDKDVDSLNPINLGKLVISDSDGFVPCTAEGILELLDYYNIEVKGKDIAVINNSDIIGKPLTLLLTNRFGTVSLCHEFTEDLKEYTKDKDIVITAAGVEGLIQPDMLSDSTILIDAAVTFQKDKQGNPILSDSGKKIRCGDSSEACKDKVKAITSITPGCGTGTGPITTALLAKNIIKAAKKKEI